MPSMVEGDDVSSIGPPVVANEGLIAVISSVSRFDASSLVYRNAHSSSVMQIAVAPREKRQLAGCVSTSTPRLSRSELAVRLDQVAQHADMIDDGLGVAVRHLRLPLARSQEQAQAVL